MQVTIAMMLSTKQYPLTIDKGEVLEPKLQMWPTPKTMFKTAERNKKICKQATNRKDQLGVTQHTGTQGVVSSYWQDSRRSSWWLIWCIGCSCQDWSECIKWSHCQCDQVEYFQCRFSQICGTVNQGKWSIECQVEQGRGWPEISRKKSKAQQPLS